MSRLNIHLVSDSTGETLKGLSQAVAAQFNNTEPVQHLWALVRNIHQIHDILGHIERKPGIILYTIVDSKLSRALSQGCQKYNLPCISVLDPLFASFSRYLGKQPTHLPGVQHTMDSNYYDRIDAMTFCLSHDDGQSISTIDLADIILVGVSRTSKTPTAFYLANRGLKVANVPLVPGVPEPDHLANLRGPVIIGLTTTPVRLAQIRMNRLITLKHAETAETSDYADLEVIREEVARARTIFDKYNWPVIDVTRRSIEESAAIILNIFRNRTWES